MDIWKMALKSERSDFLDDQTKVERAREFCFSSGYVGIGWGGSWLEDGASSSPEYLAALAKITSLDSRAARSAHNLFARQMQIGDLVWARTKKDVYWLGRITSDWTFRNGAQFADYDLFQIRRCNWCRVGSSDRIPDPVRNAFAGRGLTISRIRREASIVAAESAAIWNELTGDVVVVPSTGEVATAPLMSLGHDTLEDLVGLFLQAELGWLLVPSTAKKGTPYTEFVLRNRAAETAYVQVKSGKTQVEPPSALPEGVDRFFVFSPAGTATNQMAAGVVVLENELLEDFARQNRALLPPRVRRYFDL